MIHQNKSRLFFAELLHSNLAKCIMSFLEIGDRNHSCERTPKNVWLFGFEVLGDFHRHYFIIITNNVFDFHKVYQPFVIWVFMNTV